MTNARRFLPCLYSRTGSENAHSCLFCLSLSPMFHIAFPIVDHEFIFSCKADRTEQMAEPNLVDDLDEESNSRGERLLWIL